MEDSVFTPALRAIPDVKSADGVIMTKPWLELCGYILPVIDRFGAALALVKSDIGGNISRLQGIYDKHPEMYRDVYDIVRKEVAAKTARGSSSGTNGLLWLTRAMDFLVAMFKNLVDHADWSMHHVATEAYGATLKPYHGWFASSAFSVALKLIPSRETFMKKLGGGDLEGDMAKFVDKFSPFLAQNHEFLKSEGLDDMKAS
ncbi:hypothetical protein CBR_g5664 [Chara braunii]|uniref:Glycolipid transfer protein domain-containing protein n=1 Tax=Chara braunii TaxID=69332 RepID=A0A388JRU2_CHABU|nr:hypothetical protein CBR_g5664 [Chara braunii]|eukprot:GBG60490.1 hypothetical protein CBR_g5664 [Chara braunii]